MKILVVGFSPAREEQSHAILDANMGACRDREWEVCKPMLRSLKPGMVCLADCGFKAYEYWCQARQTGAQLLWRCRFWRITRCAGSCTRAPAASGYATPNFFASHVQ